MSNIIVREEFTPDQLELIKSTVAKGATDDELKLFLYRCKNMALDPLKPGQVHFVKYGNNPGSVIVGIDGMRLKAARTGKHNGTERGCLYDEAGKLRGGWARVHHKDMKVPVYEEALLSEYDTGRAQWAKMKETMIKKVAEAAALRIAFPDEVGGIHIEEEMAQAAREVNPSKADQVNSILTEPAPPETIIDPESDFVTQAAAKSPPDFSDYVVPIGQKYKGKKLKDLSVPTLKAFVEWVEANVQDKNDVTNEFLASASEYLKTV